MKDILYLGSQSSSRQRLLREAQIPFKLASHGSDEALERGDDSFENYVLKIAQEKMRHVCIHEPDARYILTADTLVHVVRSGRILGKPKDRDDAKNMLRAMRNEVVEVITGSCLRKQEGQKIIAQHAWTTGAFIEFSIGEEYLDTYFDKEPHVLSASGACIIDAGYGQSFFKSIRGSYTAVIGLPLFELRQELKKMGFLF